MGQAARAFGLGGLGGIVALAVLGWRIAAGPATSAATRPPCTKTYAPGARLKLAPPLAQRFKHKSWGLRRNLTIKEVAAGPHARPAKVLEIRLPKGSINPSNKSAPLGGIGFRWQPDMPRDARAACLTYGLWLPADFPFNLGGKLPGLYGGTGPTGGRAADGGNGFSLRLMWRRGGAGEVYAYIPGHPEGRGLSIGRGAWSFPRGRWVEIAEEVVLNSPGPNNGRADGIVRVWIDGVLRLERGGLRMRTTPALGLAGVLAHVFYGGKSRAWAAPRDTIVRLTPFDLRWRR